MTEWDYAGVNSQGIHYGHRKGDREDMIFYAGDREKLESYLDSRCDCSFNHTCNFHREMKTQIKSVSKF